MTRLRPRHLLIAGFVLALVLVALFAARLTFGVIYWNANQSRPIEPWMPVGYVARSWDVPPETLAEALGLEPGALPRRSLERIASEQGLPVEVLIARLEAAIAGRRTDPDD